MSLHELRRQREAEGDQDMKAFTELDGAPNEAQNTYRRRRSSSSSQIFVTHVFLVNIKIPMDIPLPIVNNVLLDFIIHLRPRVATPVQLEN